jgi:hypothetical protein
MNQLQLPFSSTVQHLTPSPPRLPISDIATFAASSGYTVCASHPGYAAIAPADFSASGTNTAPSSAGTSDVGPAST